MVVLDAFQEVTTILSTPVSALRVQLEVSLILLGHLFVLSVRLDPSMQFPALLYALCVKEELTLILKEGLPASGVTMERILMLRGQRFAFLVNGVFPRELMAHRVFAHRVMKTLMGQVPDIQQDQLVEWWQELSLQPFQLLLLYLE